MLLDLTNSHVNIQNKYVYHQYCVALNEFHVMCRWKTSNFLHCLYFKCNEYFTDKFLFANRIHPYTISYADTNTLNNLHSFCFFFSRKTKTIPTTQIISFEFVPVILMFRSKMLRGISFNLAIFRYALVASVHSDKFDCFCAYKIIAKWFVYYKYKHKCMDACVYEPVSCISLFDCDCLVYSIRWLFLCLCK